ncbi:hypothetical protein G7054_g1592 [Neopestalotiopsis clavispora]|nr:hypothetical protein G7054_g1592 [Neopestalotiopsis clavispora]
MSGWQNLYYNYKVEMLARAMIRDHQGRTLSLTGNETCAPLHYRVGNEVLHVEPMYSHGVDIDLEFDSAAFRTAMEAHAQNDRKYHSFAVFRFRWKTLQGANGQDMPDHDWSFGVQPGCTSCMAWSRNRQLLDVDDIDREYYEGGWTMRDMLLCQSEEDITYSGFNFRGMQGGEIPWDMSQPARR